MCQGVNVEGLEAYRIPSQSGCNHAGRMPFLATGFSFLVVLVILILVLDDGVIPNSAANLTMSAFALLAIPTRGR